MPDPEACGASGARVATKRRSLPPVATRSRHVKKSVRKFPLALAALSWYREAVQLLDYRPGGAGERRPGLGFPAYSARGKARQTMAARYWRCCSLRRCQPLALNQPSIAVDHDQTTPANCDRVERAAADQLIDARAANPAQPTEFADRRGNDAVRGPSAILQVDDGGCLRGAVEMSDHKDQRDQMILVILMILTRQPRRGTSLSTLGHAGELVRLS